MKTCKVCGCEIKDDDFIIEGAAVINDGMEGEYALCCGCLLEAEDNGTVIECEACGEKFSSDMLHTEEVDGHSFTACPACGKDVVEAIGRAEFEDQYFCPKYSVVVRFTDGSYRGYIVSAEGRHEVMKRMLEKLNFNYIADVCIGEILLKDDEF